MSDIDDAETTLAAAVAELRALASVLAPGKEGAA
jgi:hypothetical protein